MHFVLDLNFVSVHLGYRYNTEATLSVFVIAYRWLTV